MGTMVRKNKVSVSSPYRLNSKRFESIEIVGV